MKRSLLVFLSLFLSFPLLAQKNYFQQEVHYRIDVKINDVNHTLSATEQLVYVNHSPDTLTFLWFHLWPNAYRDANTALAKQKLESGSVGLINAPDSSRGYIDSLNFTSEGKVLSWRFDEQHIDICKITLNKPLLPGDSIEINTPFFVKIPSASFSRLGHIKQFYAISQWYPKPAVYDRYGWHPIPYLDQGEFYSEFGSFDVTITLPENYVIGATGDLVDGENEIAWLTKKSQEEIDFSSKDLSFPSSSPNYKTLRYRQNNVHDFAFFADKRYHVRKGEVTLPRSGRKVTTWAFFTNNEATLWQKGIEYINRGVSDYSRWIGEYPYSSCTAVDGTIAAGGGMEYPMITIIGACGSDKTLATTIVHEVGHNWFYGILGSNERRYPWMDEGINTYFESRSFVNANPKKVSGNSNELSATGDGIAHFIHSDRLTSQEVVDLLGHIPSGTNTAQPIASAAPDFTSINYGLIIYSKAASAMRYLENYLGTDVFDSCMHVYYERYHFRHPYPEDIQQVFEEVSGKKLDWFFHDLIETNKQHDAKVVCVKENNDQITLTLKSRNNAVWPTSVSIYKDEQELKTLWLEPKQKNQSFTIPCNGCDRILLDKDAVTQDVNNLNNNSRVNGLLKKLSPLQLQPGFGFRTSPASQLYFAPAIGWNNYNKFMAGIAVYNRFIPQKKFEYTIAPMYGFNDKELAGMARFDYHIQPMNGLFRDITLSAGLRRFAYTNDDYRNYSGTLAPAQLHYSRINPAIRFNIRPDSERSSIRQYVELSSVHLIREEVEYNRLVNGDAYGQINEFNTTFYRAAYNFSNNRTLDPYGVRLRFEGAEGLTKTDIQLKYRISYKNPRRGADFRLFAGVVWNNNVNGLYNYSLSDRSRDRGTLDYAFDELYLGRTETEGFLSKQMALRDGAFKSIIPLGMFRERMISLNIEAHLPGKLPIKVFADIATYNNLKIDQQVTYNAGLCLTLVQDALALYVPLLRSKDILKYEETNGYNLGDQIRFVFDLSKFNPINLRNQLAQ